MCMTACFPPYKWLQLFIVQAVAERTPIPGRIYSGVISEAITISRSRLLKAYVLVIIVAVCALSPSSSPRNHLTRSVTDTHVYVCHGVYPVWLRF